MRSYRRLAEVYDRKADKGRVVRARAVRRLALSTGDTVIDVCCGTGLNFVLLERTVGPTGTIVAIDHSPEMLAHARDRAAKAVWRNITFVESSVEDAGFPTMADAALFARAHDVLRTPATIDNVLGHVREGGRVVALGSKWAPRWNVLLNPVVWFSARRCITTFEGFDRPWSHLETRLADVHVWTGPLGAAYVVWGTRPTSA